jgi:hypothetical protein
MKRGKVRAPQVGGIFGRSLSRSWFPELTRGFQPEFTRGSCEADCASLVRPTCGPAAPQARKRGARVHNQRTSVAFACSAPPGLTLLYWADVSILAWPPKAMPKAHGAPRWSCIEARLHQMLDKCCRERYLKVAPFEPQLKTALIMYRRGWLTLVMVPYYIGKLNQLNVCNGHIYIYLKSREITS